MKVEAKIAFKQWGDIKAAKIREEKAKEQRIIERKERLERAKRFKKKREDEILCYTMNKLRKKKK